MLFQVLSDKIIGDVLGKAYREKRRKKRFHALLLYAFDNSAFYRNLYESHGIKREDLNDVYITDLPVVTKQMIVDNYDDVFTDKNIKIAEVKEWLAKEHQPCSNYLGKYIVVNTSGTTGEPALFIYDEKHWHYIITFNSLEFLSLKDVLTILNKNFCVTAIVANYINYGTGINMFRRNKLFRVKKEISVNTPKKKLLDNLKDIKPNGIVCYAAILSDICQAIESKRLAIRPQYILSTGEYLPKEIHKKVQSLLPECKVYDSYMATECLTLAIRDDPEKDFTVFENTNIVELLSDNYTPVIGNQEGMVVVTSLNNLVTPVIRYQFADYATSNDSNYSGKLGVSNLSSFRGKEKQVLIVKDSFGKIQKIRETQLCIFAKGLHKTQFISNKLNEVELLYTATDNLDEIVCNKFKSILKIYNSAETVKITVKKVSEILVEKNGKTKLVKLNFNL